MKTLIVDGKDAILGRLGSYVAKELLKGNSVNVVNSEEVVISGKKELMVEEIKVLRRKGSGGSLKGPKYIRTADRLLKRIIRGMLPWDRAKGRAAHKRLKCYIGEEDFSDEEIKNKILLNHRLPKKCFKLKGVVEWLK
jgi:large subunit ribosomal protein L13